MLQLTWAATPAIRGLFAPNQESSEDQDSVQQRRTAYGRTNDQTRAPARTVAKGTPSQPGQVDQGHVLARRRKGKETEKETVFDCEEEEDEE